jgi:hypothetical protein
MTPLLTWTEVATILRMDRTESDSERIRKRKAMRIMRLAGGVDLGRSDWRISEENLQSWLRKNAMGSTSVAGFGGHRRTR